MSASSYLFPAYTVAMPWHQLKVWLHPWLCCSTVLLKHSIVPAHIVFSSNKYIDLNVLRVKLYLCLTESQVDLLA